MGSKPGFSSLSDATLNRSQMTIFQDKLLTSTYCDEAGDYAASNVLSPRELHVVFKPDLSDINCTIIIILQCESAGSANKFDIRCSFCQ